MIKKIPNKFKGTTQRMMSFRLDNDNAFWLDTQPNKGRYINWLIRLDRRNLLLDNQGKKIILHKVQNGTELNFNPDDPDLTNKHDGQ